MYKNLDNYRNAIPLYLSRMYATHEVLPNNIRFKPTLIRLYRTTHPRLAKYRTSELDKTKFQPSWEGHSILDSWTKCRRNVNSYNYSQRCFLYL